MKAISLWQPYASLMAAGYKRIETRGWAPHGLRTGELVAIHAAKHWTADERALCLHDAFFKRYLTLAQRRGLWDFDHPPLGCVVAIARFKVALPTEWIHPHSYRSWLEAHLQEPSKHRWVTDHEYVFGNYGEQRYGWLFTEVRPIKPIPLRGARFLFNWLPSHQTAIGDGLPYLEPWNCLADGAYRGIGKAGA